MRRFALVGIVAAAALAAIGFGLVSADETARHDVLYTCACGPDCTCGSVGVRAGSCSCGKPMAWGHVVKIEDSDALVCTCDEGCSCKIHPDDPTRCGCGKPLKRVSLKGTGLYFCSCGGSCTCNHVSDQPGECGCGMKLEQAEAEAPTEG